MQPFLCSNRSAFQLWPVVWASIFPGFARMSSSFIHKRSSFGLKDRNIGTFECVMVKSHYWQWYCFNSYFTWIRQHLIICIHFILKNHGTLRFLIWSSFPKSTWIQYMDCMTVLAKMVCGIYQVYTKLCHSIKRGRVLITCTHFPSITLCCSFFLSAELFLFSNCQMCRAHMWYRLVQLISTAAQCILEGSQTSSHALPQALLHKNTRHRYVHKFQKNNDGKMYDIHCIELIS